ncbi:MAG: hypothetical protein AABY22_15705, partial [Nanoarchaeota archaeon]
SREQIINKYISGYHQYNYPFIPDEIRVEGMGHHNSIGNEFVDNYGIKYIFKNQKGRYFIYVPQLTQFQEEKMIQRKAEIEEEKTKQRKAEIEYRNSPEGIRKAKELDEYAKQEKLKEELIIKKQNDFFEVVKPIKKIPLAILNKLKTNGFSATIYKAPTGSQYIKIRNVETKIRIADHMGYGGRGEDVGKEYEIRFAWSRNEEKFKGILVGGEFIAFADMNYKTIVNQISDKVIDDLDLHSVTEENSSMKLGGNINSLHSSLGTAKELSITPSIKEHDMIAECAECGDMFSYSKSKEGIIWECPECKSMKRIS